MVSPYVSSLMEQAKRVGVDGRLVPFFKAVCVYFLVVRADEDAEVSPRVAAVIAKCAPILCLLAMVLLHRAGIAVSADPAAKRQRDYSFRIAVGLAMSALGDALLLWPQHFVSGMAAFAGAHVAYVSAFGWEGSAPRAALIVFPTSLVYVWVVRGPGLLALLVPGYALLLAGTAWRAAARGGPAALGAALFLLSDAALGYSTFKGPVPHRQLVVMSTYYMAQLGIALSALEPPPPAPAPAPTPTPAPLHAD